ncbi:hypothetical protein Ancab_023229 [Ancistrocladus abbreviatus]
MQAYYSNLANSITPDSRSRDKQSTENWPKYAPALHQIAGWCVNGKLEEARKLAKEMYRGGFEIRTTAYSAFLIVFVSFAGKKDPLRLQAEAECWCPAQCETFTALITNLCKIRKIGDAMKLFFRMGESGCYPNATTFLILTRSLYEAARIGEGDEMIDRLKSAECGNALDKEAYYGFLKIAWNQKN